MVIVADQYIGIAGMTGLGIAITMIMAAAPTVQRQNKEAGVTRPKT